jgi:hypothetical protein
VIPEISSGDQKVKLTETYETVGTKVKSPVDGAWKLATVYKVKGTDTSMSMISHYKTYYAGYFVWGNAIPDASNTIHTGIGFGKFEMSGNNKLKESLITASDAALEGNDFELDIELNGNDELKQTRNNSDGTKNIEVYKRLKK